MGTESVEPADAARRLSSGAPPADLTRWSGFLLSVLGQQSRAATERALAPLGIKPHHYGVLVMLRDVGPAAQFAVGDRLGIDKSSMTVVGDHLEGLGLVARRRNPQNRRAYELTLTDAGRTALAAAEPLVAQVEEAALAGLDSAERAQLHALLVKMLANRNPAGPGLAPTIESAPSPGGRTDVGKEQSV
jgi:DNA-binding MarR family transcriptional regulator